jgi:hypothetical protein
LRRFTLAFAGLLTCCCCGMASGAGQATAAGTAAKQNKQHAAALAWLGGEIAGYQRATWRWERTMGRPLVQTEGRLLAEMSIADVQRALHLWQQRAAAARRLAQKPPHLNQFLCIHHYEGNWRDGGGPYYGGLQMDLGFQRTYAPWLLRTKGTADHWTPLEQIWTAERAARSRGFFPWPNTARFCGLI